MKTFPLCRGLGLSKAQIVNFKLPVVSFQALGSQTRSPNAHILPLDWLSDFYSPYNFPAKWWVLRRECINQPQGSMNIQPHGCNILVTSNLIKEGSLSR